MTHANRKKMFHKRKKTTTRIAITIKSRRSQYRISATLSGQIHNAKRFSLAIFHFTIIISRKRFFVSSRILLFELCVFYEYSHLSLSLFLSLRLTRSVFLILIAKKPQTAYLDHFGMIERLPQENKCKLHNCLAYSIRSPFKSSWRIFNLMMSFCFIQLGR